MRSMSHRWSRVAAVLALLGVTTAAAAMDRPKAATAALVSALRGRDDAVPAAALWRLGGASAPRLLQAIVRDGNTDGHVRLRAAAALHGLGDAASLRAGVALADDASLPRRLRWHAAYGAIVLAGRIDGAGALALAGRWLWAGQGDAVDAAAVLGEAAARGLRHVSGAAAAALLQAARSHHGERLVRAAAAAALRHRASDAAARR